MDNILLEPSKTNWPELLKRPVLDTTTLEAKVAAMLNEVKINGDDAVKKYTIQFDGVDLPAITISGEEIREAVENTSEELKNAIQLASRNIHSFHLTQKDTPVKVETMPGVVCWRRSVAIENVGLYIPGGTAPLFSTLLMLAIPAQIAGCGNISVCTPAGKDGKVDPAILYTAHLLGLSNIYKIGGVQAIGALAYGTATIQKVDKIFGPGNQFVTCAKQLVNQAGIAIDMPAGPSELAVYADNTCNPSFVAADLLSQAEHGIDSQVVLVSSAEKIIKNVQDELENQLNELPRKNIAEAALKNSRWIVYDDPAIAIEFLNAYAPEHLIIASDNAENISEKIVNAGSVFLGNYSPEAAGDYASGTNHTLPTNGYAKAYSGVSVDSFVRKITYQQITREGINNIGTAVEVMATAEGLVGHRNAIKIRRNNL